MLGRNLRWFDPWSEFRSMEEAFDRMCTGEKTGGIPAINYRNNGEDAVVTAEIPGIDPKDIDISVKGRTLTISGERRREEPGEGENYLLRERWQGRFSRTVELPFSVESEKVQARFHNGVLSITLPIAEAEKPRKILITTN